MKNSKNLPPNMSIARSPRPGKHHAAWLLVGLLAVALLGMGASGAVWFYSNHVLPNVKVGNTFVGQADVASIQRAVLGQTNNLRVTFIAGSQQVTVPLSDVGVTINMPATVQSALGARRDGNFWQNIQLWQTAEVPLVFTNDWGQLKEFVQRHFPSVFVDAKNAQLAFDAPSKQFIIMPGADGKGFDLQKFERALPQVAVQPHNLSLAVSSVPVAPLVTAAGLVDTQKTANNRLGLAVKFVLDGKTVAQVSPADIAAWAFFTPDATKGTATVDFDKAKIQQYITDKVGPKIAAPPVDRKVVIDQATNTQTVISAGQNGKTIKDADLAADTIYNALHAGQSLDQQVSVIDAPFKTITLTGSGKWIEVDVTHETATIWVGSVPVQTFLISSGKAGTPTELGTFHVYYKTPSQTMTGTIAGEYFYLPNIPWVSFFDGGEAFHGTYWHHNFGHPMSHGCINMTIPDAKIVYDFAPVGTRVVVHA